MKTILKRKGGIHPRGGNFKTDTGSWLGENTTNETELIIPIK